MTDEQNASHEPEGGQVSETANLRERDDEKEIQAADGVPPASESQQEDQSRLEAEISPDDEQAADTEDAAERAEGRKQV